MTCYRIALIKRLHLGTVLLRFRFNISESGQFAAGVDHEIDAGAEGV